MKLKFDDLVNAFINETSFRVKLEAISPAYRQPQTRSPGGVGGMLAKAAGGLAKAALNVPGAIPAAANTARDFFLGNNPLGMMQQGINKGISAVKAAGEKIAEVYWSAKDKQIAKALGKRTQNPKRGDLVYIDLGTETLGLIIPGKSNKPPLKIVKAEPYQDQTVYDIPVPNNNSIDLIKMQVGEPSQPAVSLFYFLANTRVQGNRLNLPESANLINDGKINNSWIVSDKREASVEIFQTSRVLKMQGKAAAAGTAPTIPNPGENFTYRDRNMGKTTTYEIIQADAEKTYAIKIRA